MSSVWTFIKNNPMCDFLVALGLLSIYITYIGAPRASRKSGRYVSGTPVVGGMLIALGFLTSTNKWLAFIGLLEPTTLWLIFKAVPEAICENKRIKRWIPPEEFEGGKVVEYSNYRRKLEEKRIEYEEYPGSFYIQEITLYIIVAANFGYDLIGMDNRGENPILLQAGTVEECKERANKAAVWNVYADMIAKNKNRK